MVDDVNNFDFSDCFFRQNELNFALADYHQALELDAKDDSIRTRIAVVHNEYGVTEYVEKNYQVLIIF